MEVKKLKLFKDSDGILFPFEFSDLPFKPERIFCVTGVPKGSMRGDHAHYKGKQILLCLKGEIRVGFCNGIDTIAKSIRQGEYVLLNEMIWDWQIFLTGNDVLLSICSVPYDKKNYITDFQKFKQLKNS